MRIRYKFTIALVNAKKLDIRRINEMIIYNFLGSIIIKVNHLLSLAPLDVFPEKRWRGIAVPIKRSLYPFLS